MRNKFDRRGCCGCAILAVAIGAVVGLVVAIARKVIPTIMPQMMTEMMPHCLRIALPDMPQEKRITFVLKLVTSLMERSSAVMSEEEQTDFLAKVVEKVQS